MISFDGAATEEDDDDDALFNFLQLLLSIHSQSYIFFVCH
jgi:hypothetical protein